MPHSSTEETPVSAPDDNIVDGKDQLSTQSSVCYYQSTNLLMKDELQQILNGILEQLTTSSTEETEETNANKVKKLQSL